jgi:carboxypeptidase C (cathepsin A)
VCDEKGKTIADVVVTSYVLADSNSAARPVTFAFNGGPGAASVYLNLGALGPKHLPFGAADDVPLTPVQLEDNPDTWLAFTDVVFVDPVGTGFSRSLVNDEESKKRFFTMRSDIQYLSRIIYDWLVKNDRLVSPKFLAGESYGGFRVPRLTHTLQTTTGVGISGMVRSHPTLMATSRTTTTRRRWDGPYGCRRWQRLIFEREGRLSADALRPVEDYARTEFISDYLRGGRDEEATARLIVRVTELLGADPSLVKTMGGRVDTQTLLRELYRREGKIGSRYHINVTTYDPFHFSYKARTGGGQDPILDRVIAPTTGAMVDFVTALSAGKWMCPTTH